MLKTNQNNFIEFTNIVGNERKLLEEKNMSTKFSIKDGRKNEI